MGGGGGGQRVCWPPSQIIGRAWPPPPPSPLPTPMRICWTKPIPGIRAREIDKCQSVRLFSKWSALSGRTYRNSRLEVYVRIYVTFEFRKSLDRGYRREIWCIYLYIAASLFTKYLIIFLDVLSAERKLKQNKNTSEFPRINSCCFRRQAHSSSSVRVQSVK